MYTFKNVVFAFRLQKLNTILKYNIEYKKKKDKDIKIDLYIYIYKILHLY